MQTKELTTSYFNEIEDKFLQLVPKEVFAREISFALQHMATNPMLQKCEPNSLKRAVLNIAQTGLTLDPIKEFAYLIPRYNNRLQVMEAHLEAGYRGLVKSATDTGSVTNCYAHCVYEGDEFEETLGTTPGIKHIPKHTSKNIQGAYAIGVLPDGSKQVEYMVINELNDIRDFSEGYKAYKKEKIKSTPWISNPGEMCRKTVLKRLCKYLPKTEKWDKLSKVIHLDNSQYEFDIASSKANHVYSLIHNSTLDDDRKQSFENEIFGGCKNERADEIIKVLNENQQTPQERGIKTPGDAVSATDKAVESDTSNE